MKTATMQWLSAICGLAAVPIVQAGCDNHHLLGAVDGGSDTGSMQAQPDGGGSPDAPGNVPDGATTGESWTGYIENYMFPSGSDVLKISFLADGAGQVSGFVWFGNGTPPPPPTDPNVGYPADLLRLTFELTSAGRSYLAEGYAYSMRAGTVTGGRLRFTVEINELWRDWCAIQTPAGTSGSCLPNVGAMTSGDGMTCGLYDAATGQYVPVDCGKLALCRFGMVCICDTQTCTLGDASSRIMFDLTLDELRASGSTSGQLGEHNVHFTKDR